MSGELDGHGNIGGRCIKCCGTGSAKAHSWERQDRGKGYKTCDWCSGTGKANLPKSKDSK